MAGIVVKVPKVVIVGCGIIGLSTGINIQKSIPGADITIVADAFDSDITSSGAAGIIRCSTFTGLGPTPEIGRKWYGDTYKFFSDLSQTSESLEAGVSRVSGYFLAPKEEEMISVETMVDFTDEIYDLSEKAVQAIVPNSNLKYGKLLTTYVADSSYFLAYLKKKYKKNGGKIEARTVQSLAEFIGKCDVVVNCSGLRAQQLVGDKSIFAVRGQVFKLEAPWIKHFYYQSLNTYVIPGIDYVTVGGTRQLLDPSTDINQFDSLKIMDGAVKLLPSLRNAKVHRQWAGLRPQRNPIRVEKEIMTFGDKSVKVVHNYGHGGYGVTLSWGTAIHATQLVLEQLQGIEKVNSKQMPVGAKL